MLAIILLFIFGIPATSATTAPTVVILEEEFDAFWVPAGAVGPFVAWPADHEESLFLQ